MPGLQFAKPGSLVPCALLSWASGKRVAEPEAGLLVWLLCRQGGCVESPGPWPE